MRILCITDRTWPTDHSFIEEVLIKRLHKLGFSVALVFTKRDKCIELNDNIKVKIEARTSYNKLTDEIIYLCEILREIFLPKFDVIFIRNRVITAWIASIFLKHKLVYQLSHLKEEAFLFANLENKKLSIQFSKALALLSIKLRQQIIKRCKLNILVSENLRKQLKITKPDNEIQIVPLGFSETEISKEYQDKHVIFPKAKKGTKILLYVGTFNRLRKLVNVIQSFKCLKIKYNYDAQLYFVGGSGNNIDREILTNAVRNSGLKDSIFILKPVPRSMALNMISVADAGISYLPTGDFFEQNSPIKVMEYLGSGTPVIATPQMEHQYLLEYTKGGILSSSDSCEDFGEAMAACLNQTWNSEFLKKRILEIRGYDKIAEMLALKIREMGENRIE